MTTDKKPAPGYLWSMLTMKCPRCRRGQMFNDDNAYRKIRLSHIFSMPERCPVCGQKFDLEPGFWYGTGYVSYALAVAVCAATFVAWIVMIGVSSEDNRIFYWLGTNALILIILQPWLMRLSRVIYIRFFVRYDEDYEKNRPKHFE